MVSTDVRRIRARRRPAWIVADLDGHPHRVNLAAIERAFFRCVVDGKFDSRAGLAAATNLSRSIISRFLNGRGGSLRVALKILAEMGLRFDDVATPVEGPDDGAR